MINTFRKSAKRILQASALLIGSSAIVSLDLIPGAFPESLQRIATGGVVIGLLVGLMALGFIISTSFRDENNS